MFECKVLGVSVPPLPRYPGVFMAKHSIDIAFAWVEKDLEQIYYVKLAGACQGYHYKISRQSFENNYEMFLGTITLKNT